MFPKYQKNLIKILTFLSKIMQICSKTQEFTQNSREISKKPQFSGKSATLCLPENRPIKKPGLYLKVVKKESQGIEIGAAAA